MLDCWPGSRDCYAIVCGRDKFAPLVCATFFGATGNCIFDRYNVCRAATSHAMNRTSAPSPYRVGRRQQRRRGVETWIMHGMVHNNWVGGRSGVTFQRLIIIINDAELLVSRCLRWFGRVDVSPW